MTRYEREIFEIVSASRDHLSAEQIFGKLREIYPSVVLATVYNNLNKLWRNGLIRKISLEGEPDRYDRTEKHDHLFCERCGKLQDVVLTDLTEQLGRQLDVPFVSYDLRLIYVCEDCRKRIHADGISKTT